VLRESTASGQTTLGLVVGWMTALLVFLPPFCPQFLYAPQYRVVLTDLLFGTCSIVHTVWLMVNPPLYYTNCTCRATRTFYSCSLIDETRHAACVSHLENSTPASSDIGILDAEMNLFIQVLPYLEIVRELRVQDVSAFGLSLV
jgi:hypothetical protein